jgi:stage V sporulation protein G
MRITEIQIVPIKPNNGLIAIASVVIEGSLYLGSIGIHTKLKGGYRITYPTKSLSGKSFNIFHPINRETALLIEQAVIRQVNKVLSYNNEISNDYDGHNNTYNSAGSL